MNQNTTDSEIPCDSVRSDTALAICLDNRSAKPTIVTMVALTKKLPQ
jgi:hypothetical protein